MATGSVVRNCHTAVTRPCHQRAEGRNKSVAFMMNLFPRACVLSFSLTLPISFHFAPEYVSVSDRALGMHVAFGRMLTWNSSVVCFSTWRNTQRAPSHALPGRRNAGNDDICCRGHQAKAGVSRATTARGRSIDSVLVSSLTAWGLNECVVARKFLRTLTAGFLSGADVRLERSNLAIPVIENGHVQPTATS